MPVEAHVVLRQEGACPLDDESWKDVETYARNLLKFQAAFYIAKDMLADSEKHVTVANSLVQDVLLVDDIETQPLYSMIAPFSQNLAFVTIDEAKDAMADLLFESGSYTRSQLEDLVSVFEYSRVDSLPIGTCLICFHCSDIIMGVVLHCSLL